MNATNLCMKKGISEYRLKPSQGAKRPGCFLPSKYQNSIPLPNMVLTSTRIPNKNKENAHIRPCLRVGSGAKVGNLSVPRKRTHAQTLQPKTRLVPARTENLCSLLRESCYLGEKPFKSGLQQGKLSLPKTLRRPAFRAITPQCLAAANPELASVPLEFIQQELREKSERYISRASLQFKEFT